MILIRTNRYIGACYLPHPGYGQSRQTTKQIIDDSLAQDTAPYPNIYYNQFSR